MTSGTESQDNLTLDTSFYDKMAGTYDVIGTMDYTHPIIINEIRGQESGSILELGIGTGSLVSRLAENAEFVNGIEYSDGMIEVARSKTEEMDNVHIIKADFTEVLPELGLFDAVVGSYILTHVADVPEFLMNITDYLQPGGKIVIVDHIQDFSSESAVKTLRGVRDEKMKYDGSNIVSASIFAGIQSARSAGLLFRRNFRDMTRNDRGPEEIDLMLNQIEEVFQGSSFRFEATKYGAILKIVIEKPLNTQEA